MKLKEIQKNGVILFKDGNKILAFVGKNGGVPFYAFGKPSQSEYVAFNMSTIKAAKEKIKETLKPKIWS